MDFFALLCAFASLQLKKIATKSLRHKGSQNKNMYTKYIDYQ